MPIDARAIEGMMMQGLTIPSGVRGRGWLAAAAPLQPRRAQAAHPPARGRGAS
jgi:hypothetical protein